MEQVSQHRGGAHRLAEPHLVGKDAVKAVSEECAKPLQRAKLMREQHTAARPRVGGVLQLRGRAVRCNFRSCNVDSG